MWSITLVLWPLTIHSGSLRRGDELPQSGVAHLAEVMHSHIFLWRFELEISTHMRCGILSKADGVKGLGVAFWAGVMVSDI